MIPTKRVTSLLLAVAFVAPFSAAQEMPPALVKTAPIEELEFHDQLTLVGRTEARRESRIVAEVAGRVKSLPAEEGSSIAWDDGEPWRFRLRAEEDDQRQLWRLSGQVCRGGEVVSFSDVVLLMATGIILFPDKLARLDVSPDHFGWIVILRAQPAIQVPYSDRDQWLDTLYHFPELPEMDLPAALRVDQLLGNPRGRVEIKSNSKKRVWFLYPQSDTVGLIS